MRSIVLILMTVFTVSLSAQRAEMSEERKEKMEAMKVAYITKKLDLNTEEAQKFWPVYNELQKKRKALRVQSKQNHKEIKEKWDTVSDKDIELLVEKEFELKAKGLALEKQYHEKMKETVELKKLVRLYEAEKQFKREMIQTLRKKKEPGNESYRRH